MSPPTHGEGSWEATDIDISVDETVYIVGTLRPRPADAVQVFLQVYDGDSVFVRTETFSDEMVAPTIESDAHGALYVSGGNATDDDGESKEAIVRKLDAAGGTVWRRVVAAEFGLEWRDIDVDETGRVTLCAMTIIGEDGIPSEKRAPFFVQFDPAGEILWEVRGLETDTCVRIAARGRRVLISGTTAPAAEPTMNGLGWLDVETGKVDWTPARRSQSLSLGNLFGYSTNNDRAIFESLPIGGQVVVEESLKSGYWGAVVGLSDVRFGHLALVRDTGDEYCCDDWGDVYDEYWTVAQVRSAEGQRVYTTVYEGGMGATWINGAHLTVELGTTSLVAMVPGEREFLRAWWRE